jgi:regulator of telomere elongation helicase 1
MPVYSIRGFNVNFPFEAYECQKLFMGKVLEALENVSQFFYLE